MKEQLDLLARNVHEWPVGNPAAFFFKNVIAFTHQADHAAPRAHLFTKQQWLDRRAELQNKPSWKDAPEWATHLAQAANGCWFFLGGNSVKLRTNILHEQVWSASQAETRDWKGEVLSDWRDTLECRPADMSEPAVTARLQEATDNVLAAVPELKSDKYKFEQFTSLEDAPAAATLHTIHHAAFLHQGCQLLLSEPELVVFRTADGELIHCKPKECLIDPDVYGLAARLLADMSGHPVAPEHMRELCEQIGWPV